MPTDAAMPSQASDQSGTALLPLWGRTLEQDVLDVLAFLIPSTLFVEMQVVGRLFAPDILLAAIFPILFALRGRRLADHLPRTFLLLAGLWLLGQVLTDLVQHTPFHDYSRGWAKIGFTIVNFCALYLLLDGRPRRIVLYAAGVATGKVVEYLVNPGWQAADLPWKFGYGLSVTWLLVLAAVGVAGLPRVRRFSAIGLLVGASVLNLAMGFRSLGGLLFIAATYMTVQTQWSGPRRNPRRTPVRNVVLFTGAVGIAAWGALELYSRAVESGVLGVEAEEIYVGQAVGEYGLLLGGRSEALASIPAILDSPILGHGSWATDCSYSSMHTELKRELGYSSGGEDEECLIPTHSHFLGAWVEAGISGALFWGWVLSLTVRALLRSFEVRERLTPLIAFVGFLLVWDILFSPYGAARRFVTPFYVVVMMMCLQGFRSATLQQHKAALFGGAVGPESRQVP